eukprot:7802752-Karenia_brevis.AAC.1
MRWSHGNVYCWIGPRGYQLGCLILELLTVGLGPGMFWFGSGRAAAFKLHPGCPLRLDPGHVQFWRGPSGNIVSG